MRKLKLLDLFSGIGGFSLGLERTGGFETVAFCEYDEKAQKVLKKHWPNVPIYKDVRTLDYDGTVDIITGGYPCQPFSVAGKRKGAEDDRHLWPAMFSLIKKYRPVWVIGENVAGHISMGLDSVLADLEGEAYTTRTFVIPACAVDAKHRRDRLWIVAHSERKRASCGEPNREYAIYANPCCEVMAYSTSCEGNVNADDEGSRQLRTQKIPRNICGTSTHRGGGEPRRWAFEPNVGRVAHGIPNRVDRLKQLGNAVVPQIPELIGNAILEVEGYNANEQCN